jgi:cytoskeletal protein CcmA (bactofilin family)
MALKSPPVFFVIERISPKKSIEGSIGGIIGGVVLGDVSATESVKLLSSSVVLGNIISKKVQMEENVVFQGHCISIEKEEKYKLSVDKFLQAKAIREKAVLK